MELRHIRYFLALVDTGNFGRAAEAIGIGQPPLSLQIKALEKEVGTTLFRRVPKGAELTAAGQAFFERVKRMPALADEAASAARRAARGELGALRIGFTASAAFNPAVTGAIRRFRRSYADVELHLTEAHTRTLVDELLEQNLDAVFLRPERPAWELRYQRLSDELLLVALPEHHALADARTVRLGALHAEPFILSPREVGPLLFDTVINACREAGFEPRLGQAAPQFTTIVRLVAADLGVALVPASMQQISAEGVVYRSLSDVSPSTHLSLAWRRTDRSPFLQNFLHAALN